MKAPYFVIPMSLTADGRGPAGEHETARTVYQIWDECFCTIAEFETEAEAQVECSRLAELWRLTHG